MSVHVSPVAALSNYQSHSRNPSHSHAHPHPDPLLDTIPSSPHTMSLHTQAHTPISPRAWPVGNILDDLEKWQIEEESELIAIDADRDEMEHAKTKEESSNKDKEKSQATTPRRISRLFRAISPRTSPATSPSPSPSSSSPHLIPVKHSAIVPISAVAPIATATATPPLLLSPTASPARSLSSTPQPSPRQSPQPSPQPSPSTTPRAPLDGRPPTPRRSIHRTLKSPRMYLDEYHYLQHNPISPVMKILDRDYQIVDTAVTQVPIKPVKPIKKKEKKHRHVPSSAPSSPCQTPTRPPSSSHSKTPPPRSFSARSSRGAISMLPSDTDVRPRSHPLPSPITLPRQTISEPSPIHAPALPTFHPKHTHHISSQPPTHTRMIVYYDIVSGKEIGSDAFDETTPVPGIKSIVSTKITIKEGDVDIGANASAEAEEDESFDASEARTVINVVEAGHLQKMELSKKELKTLTQSYWKTLLKELTRQKFDQLGFPEDYKAPDDKAQAKADEEKALGELKGYALTKYNEVADKLASFRKNFDAIQKWFTDDVLANFDEYEFYTCEEGELGKCMIIPARYVGEATAPVFFFYADGIREKKE